MKTIKLAFFGIVIRTNRKGSGTIESDLKEPCPGCGSPCCYFDCPAPQRDRTAETEAEARQRLESNCRIDGIESLILAAACAGIDVTTPAFAQAIETAVEAIWNQD
jgi:hypothetical protein